MKKEPLKDEIPFVDAIKPDELAKAIKSRLIDKSSKRVMDEELRYLSMWREANDRASDDESIRASLTGLAISGGGIRSATFALGVVQALAREDKMRCFDYISTVSGGGYLGCSLTWLTSSLYAREAKQSPNYFSMNAEGFPYGTCPPGASDPSERGADQEQQLIYLRQHGKYLAPGDGIDVMSGIAVLLRGMLLNAIVWFPLSALVCFVLLLFGRHAEWWPQFVTQLLSMLPGEQKANGYLVLAVICVLALLCFVGYSLVYSAFTCVTGVIPWRYAARRCFESLVRYPLRLFLACVPIALLPSVSALVHHPLKAGVASAVLGAISAVWTHVTTRNSRKTQGPFLSVFAMVGAFLVLYGIAVTAYGWADTAFSAFAGCTGTFSACLIDTEKTVWLLAFAALALLSGWFVNINLISMHRFYRDRLMEAYMPEPCAPDTPASERKGRAPAADKARLSEFCQTAPANAAAHCPYPLINTNLILTRSDQRTWRLRGGDSFLLSPRMCGSNATGWCDTKQFIGNDMTLATAMAISGAAANPDAGGALLRNRFVALLMALANVRLGYWVANPAIFRDSAKHRNHFTVGWREITSHFKETAKLIELSDGGHFDNLGLYELVRRRTRLIMLCDGTADPEFTFPDFISTLARIKADFGASISFAQDAGLSIFIPQRAGGYPQTARFAKDGFAIAKITYADGTQGDLIYITSTLITKVGLDVRGYKAAYADFPDQTTVDQFFDEAQFEAYRALGYAISEAMLSDVACREILDKFLCNKTQIVSGDE